MPLARRGHFGWMIVDAGAGLSSATTRTQEFRKRSALSNGLKPPKGTRYAYHQPLKKIIVGALRSGGVAVAGIGLGAGTAQAVCSIYPQQPQWAPPEGPAGCYDSGICGQEW
jgi:hypothetical protein